MPVLPSGLTEPLWSQFAALLPERSTYAPTHPLGCHRPRISDRVVFDKPDHMDRAREHIRPWLGATLVTTDVDGARATLARYAERQARDGAGSTASGTAVCWWAM